MKQFIKKLIIFYIIISVSIPLLFYVSTTPMGIVYTMGITKFIIGMTITFMAVYTLIFYKLYWNDCQLKSGKTLKLERVKYTVNFIPSGDFTYSSQEELDGLLHEYSDIFNHLICDYAKDKHLTYHVIDLPKDEIRV